jgi:hypothetical protein
MTDPVAIMSAPALFEATGPVALAGWLSLVLLPRRVRWRRAVAGTAVPLLLAAAYAGLIAAGWSRAEGGFDSFVAVRQLFASDLALLAGWLHYLAFDLLIGVHIDERAERANISKLAVLPAFVLTFLFGPAGWMLYRVQEWLTLSRRGPARETSTEPDASLGAIGLLRWAVARADRGFLLVAAANLAIIPPSLVAALVDDRTLDGANVWMKPLKFACSLAIYCATLAIMSPLAGTAFARSRARSWMVRIIAVASAVEMPWIVLQAARGARSHFNQESAVGVAMYAVMGVFAVALVLAPIPLAVHAWRTRTGGLRAGIVAAVTLNVLAGGAVGAWLSTRGSHFIGGDESGATGLPFLGWSTTGGDLRIAHFVGLHAMQAMLAAGLIASRWKPRTGSLAVWLAAAAWTGLTGWLTMLAIRGQPAF